MITYEFKIKTNNRLKDAVENHLGCTRLVYNLALEVREDAYKKGVSLSKFDLIKQLPELKQEFKWLKNVHSQTLQGVIERLQRGYDKFFRDLKQGKKTSKPKWARKKEWNSVEWKKAAVKYEGGSEINISKIGKVRFFKSRDIKGNIKLARIIKRVDGYYLQVVTDNEYTRCENQAVCGIDLGITHFVVTSDGEYFENARTLRKYLKELRIENRSLSRKKKFSRNFYKQVERLKRLHLKISRIRKDYLHKTSTKLAQEYSTIVCEDLNIQEMIKERRYSREISDVAWGRFLEMLEYKTNLIRVDPKYTSQECNRCGHTCKENRPTQEKFNCVKCGHTGNADQEASLTILKRGQTLLHANVSQ